MRKIWKISCAILLLLAFFVTGGLLADRQYLHNELVRLHILANSDTDLDQQNKLAIRDSVLSWIQTYMQDTDSAAQAMEYLQAARPEIEGFVNDQLKNMGCEYTARVSLVEEEFDTRYYDTFSLPAGIYNSLKIELGKAAGENWWCVVFPSLCLPTSVDAFQDAAVSAGVQGNLTNTLAGEGGYTVRFFLLDCLGKIENFLHFE